MVNMQPARPLSGDVLQSILVSELAAILEVEDCHIDPSRPFEEYGLDSTDAIIVVGLVEEKIGMELEPELLLRNRTIEEVVASLKQLGTIS